MSLIRIVPDMLDALPSTSSSTFDSDKGHPGDRSSGGRDREVPGMEASEGQGESGELHIRRREPLSIWHLG